MTIRDKVAMILTMHGFSLAEGLQMFDESITPCEYVKVDSERDCVVWLNHEYDGEIKVYVTVWRDYAKSFCLNYSLAGAVALNDDGLNIPPEDKAKFLDFFALCQKAYRASEDLPKLNNDMKWIFTISALDDYMDYSNYDVRDKTEISVSIYRQ